MKNTKITIIGGGNIGSAIAFGLLKSKVIPVDNLTVAGREKKQLLQQFGKTINTTVKTSIAIKGSKYIIIAVKPHSMVKVISQIKNHITEDQIILSVVSSVTIDEIAEMLKKSNYIFRIMPNTAISIEEAITCISSSKKIKSDDIEEVEKIFNHMGKTLIIPEYLMGAATVLGSCGIAFALRFLRAATQGGIQIGFHAKTSQFISAQILKGAAELILNSEQHPEEEIDKVTTPMGITIEGLNEMEFNGFSSSLIKGILASYKKVHN